MLVKVEYKELFFSWLGGVFVIYIEQEETGSVPADDLLYIIVIIVVLEQDGNGSLQPPCWERCFVQ